MNLPQKATRGSVVGVDFGPAEIRIVRLRSGSDEQFCFDRYHISPTPRDLEPGSEGLASAVREAISEVCDHPRDTPVWAVMGVDRVRIHHLKIPAMPQGK